MTYALHLGSDGGLRRALPGIAGSILGLVLLLVLSQAGLGTMLTLYPAMLALITVLGGLYLCHLGLRAWRAAHQAAHAVNAPSQSRARFRRGFTVALSNPKALLYFFAFFPAFISPDKPWAPQVALLATTHLLLDLSWQLTYASFGAKLLARLGQPARVQRFSGALFLVLGSALILQTALSSLRAP